MIRRDFMKSLGFFAAAAAGLTPLGPSVAPTPNTVTITLTGLVAGSRYTVYDDSGNFLGEGTAEGEDPSIEFEPPDGMVTVRTISFPETSYESYL